ncbi:MAG TPA: dTDP-4-dehydrorhamnose 3,5-epimerase [Thermoanaerobaculia bacterium]|jgi:dTDP-4-dehydrorhamnose 3,5-epimerase|nr:dTDP-4-dehydrorhamnose 3,5-epimerase [Thermoanaerobaculia bacterium]
MRVVETELPGVLVVEPTVHRDARGFFLESYNERRYREAGIDAVFVQDNHSRSAARTLRGLHLQVKSPQGKLVRVIEGEIWDVAVDVRPGSPTYRRWVGVVLSAENFRQIWVPPGFAHGFCVLSELAQVEYKVTVPWDRDDELSIAWDDPELAIAWPVDQPLLSVKDRDAPRLAEVAPRLGAPA